ncbi:hypothetical protein ACFLTU_06460 [Bacteroidota bacterium]
MIPKKRNIALKYLFIFAIIVFSQGKVSAINYPDVISDFSGGATYCQNDAVTDLSVTYTTCRDGNNQPWSIVVTWYSNSVNSNSGGTQVAQTSSNTLTTTFTYAPATTSVGTLYYYVEITWTSSGNPVCGDAGTLLTSTQTVIVDPPTPSTPGSITGSTSVSPSTGGLTYSISAVPNADTYNWTVPTGWSLDAGQGSTSITVTSGTSGQDGNITVTATNSCGTSAPSTLGVTVLGSDCPVSTNVAPSAIQAICQDDPSNTLTASISTSGGTGTPSLLYQWYYNTTNVNTVAGATLIAGATNDTYTPLTTVSEIGSRWYFCVGYATDNGCSQSNADQSLASNAVEVTVNPPQPDTPGAISGTTPVPPSTGGLVYSIASVPNATTYTWAFPTGWSITGGQGTTSATLTSGTVGQDGNITVTAGNSCGTSSASSFAVTVEDVPASDCPASTSVSPSGIQIHCIGDPATQLTASITTSGGTGTPTLQYQWYYNTSNSNTVSGASLIAGATNNTYTPLTTASEIGSRWYFCVGYAADNGCGQTNADQSLTSNAVEISVVDVPSTPGAITGADPVNPSTTGLVYSISAVLTATSYNWTVPTGWSITGGQGTISVTLTSGTEGQDGDITVTATNSCGTSAASTKAVTVTTATLPPTITLGANPTVCQGTTSADLTYGATTESPDQYSIDYFTASEAEGFSDIVNDTLPASPIVLTVPAGAADGTYYGNLSVRNSTSGLSSGNYPISVSVIITPATPGLIFGNTTVPETTTGLSYAILGVNYATNYNWTVPTNWTITSGQGTSGIIVTSGNAGDDGFITVTAGNSCGTSAAATLAVVSETPLDHSLYGCNACHITHSSLGGSLTNTFGNSNLCLSCHVSSGAASTKPFTNANKAIPGTSGNSHSWDAPSVNATYETVLTTDPDMVLRIDAGNITCSTCHDQHNSNLNINYTRISNAGDFMCKDCHAPRNVGRYTDNPSLNKGSHPVGLDYTGTGDFESAPTGSAILIGGKVECSSCHQTHYASTTDGTLLRQTNDDALCTSCHTLSMHNGMSCSDCHQTHNTNKANIYMIRDSIVTPTSGTKPVVFDTLTGPNSFADGDVIYDGICEVCHDAAYDATPLAHFLNDGTGSDQNHTSQGAGIPMQNCTRCHPHNANFAPQGCDECHTKAFPNWGTTDNHATHTNKYPYGCSTCHLNYGSGGSLEGSHPNSTLNPDSTMNTLARANVNLDLAGLATRNGQDIGLDNYVAPGYDAPTYTCTNIYCHSNGRSAYRGTNGGANLYDTWSSQIGYEAGTLVYRTIPAWNSSTDVSCGKNPISGFTCHEGPSSIESVSGYLINDVDHRFNMESGNAAKDYYPSTGSHGPNRGAHASNSQNLKPGGDNSTEWGAVQCFWCHNTDNTIANGPKYQGTYGTSFHADGETYFIDARWFSNGGSLIDPITYSFEGSATHCGQSSNSCW